jgi:hypothetical protein
MFKKEIDFNFSETKEKERILIKINSIISSIFCPKHHAVAHLEIKDSKFLLFTCCREHGEYISRVIHEILI